MLLAISVCSVYSQETQTVANLRYCYSCDGPGGECHSEDDIGTIVTCQEGVTSCFKQQTSSRTESIVRKCSSVGKTGTSCLQSSVNLKYEGIGGLDVPTWVCHCETDGCNGSHRVDLAIFN